MPRFRITTKQRKMSNGILIEPGLSVEVITQSYSNPITNNGGQAVVDAYMCVYGLDIKKAGALSTVWLDVKQM